MNQRIKNTMLTCSLLLVSVVALATAGPATLRQQMDLLHERHGVSFVYDASLPVTQPYQGPELSALSLPKALKTLFAGTGIDYRLTGQTVLLTRSREPQKPHSYTLSGHVRDSVGEVLINATVFDLTTGQGTLTNEYGYYSLTLPAGQHHLRVSYIGCAECRQALQLSDHCQQDFTLGGGQRLGEVVVTGDLNSPVTGTQMGKRSLAQADIKTEYALLSSPDVVKTLQRFSGVQEGIELASGLYVHGGNGDENLFLLDGTPLYHTNHSLGLFSSFNPDVVKNVDFYKSGFPARYGGRLSSVTDVRTNDGDMYRWRGQYRIGLLDGSFQLEGPIRKGRTSLNFGLRRSWLDLITRPAFAVYNAVVDDERMSLAFDFHDLNLKLTHIVNDRQRLSLSLYSGNDALTTSYKYESRWQEGVFGYDAEGNSVLADMADCYTLENDKGQLRWGNLNAALNWNVQLHPRLMANFTAVYTRNRSKFYTLSDFVDDYGRGQPADVSHNEHTTTSTINDLGYRSEFDYRPSPRHHIRFGHDYTMHVFSPQTHTLLTFVGDSERSDTVNTRSQNRHTSHELTLYAEDQLTLDDRWSLNAGLNASVFGIGGKTFASADPRLAVKYQLRPNLALKASYTMMTQYVHKISNSLLEMPTDYWVPTTARLHPMHSHQWAVGAYSQWGRHWHLSLEGYYKLSRHLLQYVSWAGLEPPAASWDENVMDGRGRFYGTELDAEYRAKWGTLTAAYTLSWNERRFDGYYDHWYPDKFDNRHKLTLTGRFRLGAKAEAYAAWTFHTGNRMTMPTQFVNYAELPGVLVDGYGSHDASAPLVYQSYLLGIWRGFVYERPNNVVLPAYHRLDVGFNFHHTTKHGHERIWNVSVYNAYCHLNTMWTEVDFDDDGRFRIKTRGFLPVIPSCSYTIKF